ncbi:hypothetical protein BD413DRAFT_468435 [Trametes elegans]|nr:hypothetical protein BD413DRAFT_468435 [Trametes elegans]
MSVAIALPPLDKWVQDHIGALYSAKDEQAFDAEFERVFSQHVSVRVNGKHLSRAEYKKLLLGEIKGDSGADVQFNSVIAVPAEGGAETIGTGSVGVSFKAVISGRLFVFAQRESSTVNSSLNVV